MFTARETILAALHTRLSALPATTLRGEVLPERVPAEGLLILRDGEPGEPEVTLSPLRYHYQHRAEIEAVVQGGTSLHGDNAPGLLCNERQQLTSGKLLAKHDRPVPARPVQLENALCKVNSDDGNFRHGCSLLL